MKILLGDHILQWAADALKKKTNIRDYREDSLTDKDSPGLIR